MIAAFDGLKYSPATAACAISLARQCNAHLVGLFLDDLIYHSYRVKDLIEDDTFSDKKFHELNRQDEATRQAAMEKFEVACQTASVQYAVHHNRKVALRELLHESIYCDLLIIGRQESFLMHQNKFPSEFIQDVLADVQCPVLLVPETYTEPQALIFLYDGEPSSVYAIKMFCYTLSGLTQLPARVLSVKPAGGSLHLPDNRLMKEFMKRHLPNAEYLVLKGEAEPTILTFLQQQHNHALVVLGAYQRGRVSRWFKPSMADLLMQQLKAPLFIAHRK